MDLVSQLLALNVASKSLIAATFGIASHQLYFIRGEHHLQAPTITWLAIVIPIVIFGVKSGQGIRNALLHSIIVDYLRSI